MIYHKFFCSSKRKIKGVIFLETSSLGMFPIANAVGAVVCGLADIKTLRVGSMSVGITQVWAKRVSGKNVTRGVSVEVGQVEAAIDLRIIVDYGVKIQDVSRELQANVKEAVETMTGLNVVEVNVKVEGVDFKEEKQESEERVK